MKITIANNKTELGRKAAGQGADHIRSAIAQSGRARIILATGASQFEMLSALTREEIEWSKVACFHLDEYIALPSSHPASFRKYLKERFADVVQPGQFHYIDGEAPAREECQRLGKLIKVQPIDVAFIGIGENGHLAFNDPPANFETEEPYIEVELDEACRRQQLGEGWFKDLEAVPRHAISMSIFQIMQSKHIICTVPDQRKAQAVQRALQGPVTNMLPASILQQHPSVHLYLDPHSASLL